MARDPRFYDPAQVEAIQSAIPSQQMPLGTPYLAQEINQKTISPEAVPSANFVTYTWDTRPPLSQDFQLTTAPNPDTGITIATFVVPQGYICILRSITGQLYSTVIGGPIAVDIIGTPIVVGGQNILLAMTIDGLSVPFFGSTSPTDGLNELDISTSTMGQFEVDCFVLANQNQTIQVFFDPEAVGYITLGGTLLVSTGRDLIMEPTEPNPIPVTVSNG